MAYYVIGEGNNFYEGMTKEEILAAITQAVSTHAIADVDTGFVTTIKEKNKNNPLSLWVGTEAEYNAIEEKDQNCLYIKTDDSTLEAIGDELNEYNQRLSDFEEYFTSVTNSIDQDTDETHIVNQNFNNYDLTAQKTGNIVSVVGKAFDLRSTHNQRDTIFNIDELLYGSGTQQKNLQPVGNYLIFPLFDMGDYERIGYGEITVSETGHTTVEYNLYSDAAASVEFNFNFTYLIKAGA